MKILAEVTQETYNLLEIKGANDLVNRLVLGKLSKKDANLMKNSIEAAIT